MDKFGSELQSTSWQRLHFFQGFTLPETRDLLTGSQVIRTKGKMDVFLQDSPTTHFGFVVAGLFRLQRFNANGQRVVLDIVGPNELIGTLSMAKPNGPSSFSVQSVGAGEFLKIPRATFHQTWLTSAEAMRKTQARQLELFENIQRIRYFQRASLEEKIASLLLQWDSKFHDDLTVSRTDIADTLGTTTESVIRVLSAWVNRGLIVKSPGGRIQMNHAKIKCEILHADI